MDTTSIMAVIGIAVPVISWAGILYQNGNRRGSIDATTKATIEQMKKDVSLIPDLKESVADIKAIKEDVARLNRTIGNGGYSGLRGEIQNLQIHCAEEMAGLKAEVCNIKEKAKEE
jgi:hypothetical protein